MADETATDTTEAETSQTEATETEQTTTDKVVDQTDATDKTAETEKGEESPDKSLMTKGSDDEEQDEAAQIPDKYDLTPPEGFEINDELLGEVSPVFRDLKLNNEQANKVVALAKPFADRLFARQQDAFQAQASDWAKQAKADSEIGGKNWSETESLVAKALDKLGAPKEFRALLDDTKLGNHPEMIRMFRRLGAAISEDTSLPRGDGSAQVRPDRLAALYPNDVPKTEGVN